MKNYFHLATLLTLFGLSSCTLEPFEMTKEEEYTRSFIKQFGLIDPSQNWNLAQRAEVNVKVDHLISTLKVYAEVDGKYYLVADYRNVSEPVTIPIDVPGGTNNIKVKADGNVIFGTLGQTIDCTGIESRNLPETKTGTIGSYTVTISELSEDGNKYNSMQIAPITTNGLWEDYWSINDARWKFNSYSTHGLIPENGIDKDRYGEWGGNQYGNRFNSGILQDFMIEPDNGSFDVYPMYWNTSNQHVLGIYLIDQNGNAITTDGQPAASNGSNIKKFPIYRDKQLNDIKVYLKSSTLRMDPSTVTVEVGKTSRAVYPKPMLYVSSITYTSSDETVATVNDNYEITGVSPGTATITATLVTEGTNHTYTATCDVTVTSIDIPFTITPSQLSEGFRTYLENLETNNGKHYFDSSDNTKFDLFENSSIPKSYFNDFIVAFQNYSKDNLGDVYTNMVTPYRTDGKTTPADISQYEAYVSEPIQPIWGNFTNDYFRGRLRLVPKTTSSAPKLSRSMSRASASDPMPTSLVEEGGTWESVCGYRWKHIADESYPITEPLLLKSKGIHISIPGFTGKVGMYITNLVWKNNTWVDDDVTFFSQRKYNKYSGCVDSDKGESHAASFKHPESNRVFFSFEDWVNLAQANGQTYQYGWSDKDLNDLVFRVTGFKSITDDNTSISEDDETIDWIWAVEDLGATDDFDFNDVIVKITSVTTNYHSTNHGETTTTTTRKVTFKPLAAGGTMRIFLHWGNYVLKPGTYYESDAMPTDGGSYNNISQLAASSATGDSEYHRWFGVQDYTTMINTTRITNSSAECVLYLTTPFTIAGFGNVTSMDATSQTQTNKLFVSVNGPNSDTGASQIDVTQASVDTYTVQSPVSGTPAQMFIIYGNNWKWPTERTHINEAYPQFDDWIGAPSTKWYLNPAPDRQDKKLTIGIN